jgi:hypothetical protein
VNLQSSSRKLLDGKRFVVCGDDPLRYSIYNSLAQVIDRRRLDLASDEHHARELLWTAGDSLNFFDRTHLVFVSRSILTADKLFRTHCRCRPNASQNATLNGIGAGWSGGMLFIGPNTQDIDKLRMMEPFNRIRAGHDLLSSSTRLLNVLQTIANLQPIYPEKWRETLLSIDGLSELRHLLRDLKTKRIPLQSQLSSLSETLTRVLADDLLGMLFAHADVKGALRDMVAEITAAQNAEAVTCSAPFVEKVNDILADYL